ncbi:glycine cleavage system aminomethyltransferase GcvT [Acholeplasma granularum]|uniref:glycine cleavage system aminomethyltransferase GcvT n=1 Tax=Acholeplasma granularum TaxID=264635 RepID=UPI0004B2C8EE|nr:glycine cleavage system aminomethyltransferase GcvT [Acholeplasma granularum]
MPMNNLRKTFLHSKHVSLGANLINFGGFDMPLYYTSIAEEHHFVRNNCGIFDVSHMGQIVISGEDALNFSNYILTAKIEVSRKIQYALLVNDKGNIVDDLMVYPFSEDQILLVVNASNIEKDYDHLLNNKEKFDVVIRNISDSFGCIAIQGPESFNKMSKIFKNLPLHSSDYMYFNDENGPLLISRSGYTGEDGFEVYAHDSYINQIWDKLYDDGVKPIGLGARDTLRFEAAMPLYGNEMDETINPFEAGLGFAVDFTKTDFFARNILINQKDTLTRKSVALELIDKNIARSGYEVFFEGTKIGFITTGYLSPTTKKALAFALIDINYAKLGSTVDIMIRNKYYKAIIRNKKFINKNNKI